VRIFLVPCSAVLGALLLAGCSDTGGGGELRVTLDEWSITLDKESLPEGPIEFVIKNDGEFEHELVILRTDIAPDELPTKDDGSADLKAPDVDVVRTIDEIGDGDETGRTYELKAGSYVFIDNTVREHEGSRVSYYAEGMRAAFTITEKDAATASPESD
jgi:hypothetical protein